VVLSIFVVETCLKTGVISDAKRGSRMTRKKQFGQLIDKHQMTSKPFPQLLEEVTVLEVLYPRTTTTIASSRVTILLKRVNMVTAPMGEACSLITTKAPQTTSHPITVTTAHPQVIITVAVIIIINFQTQDITNSTLGI
jgi:hypothetical protein